LQGAIDGSQQRRLVVGLLEVVKRSAAQRFLRGFDGAMSGQKNYDYRRILTEQMLQKLDAVHPGHFQIR
jgi:hypothetical protein